MIETIIDKWKIIERKTKKNIKKITKRNNSALNFKQAEWTKKSTDENEIKFYKINKITIESTFSVTNTARAERKRWHSIIYESIYLYLISSLIRFVTSSSLISVSSHYNIRSCDAQIRRFERRCLEQRICFYERILSEHLLSHEDEKTIKHRFSFANERTNRTSKSEFRTFFTNVLLRKTNEMSKIFISDWIRLLKQRTIHH
jgi:hypothetical protein